MQQQTLPWSKEADSEDTAPFPPALSLGIPFGLCGVFVLVTFLLLPLNEFLILFGMMVAYVVPPAGRETVIPLAIVLGIPWWLIAATLAFLDFAGGLFMAWNFPLALKIPIVGPWIRQFMEAGQTYLAERPWLEKLYFLGLVLFVSIPFEGSGSITGSIIGRMLGMGKTEVLACITIGGIIGSFCIAIGADYIRGVFLLDVTLGFSLLVFILIGIAIAVMYRSSRRKRSR